MVKMYGDLSLYQQKKTSFSYLHIYLVNSKAVITSVHEVIFVFFLVDKPVGFAYF